MGSYKFRVRKCRRKNIDTQKPKESVRWSRRSATLDQSPLVNGSKARGQWGVEEDSGGCERLSEEMSAMATGPRRRRRRGWRRRIDQSTEDKTDAKTTSAHAQDKTGSGSRKHAHVSTKQWAGSMVCGGSTQDASTWQWTGRT